MYEVRCPKCNKKLAEIGRQPIQEFSYTKLCKCGKEMRGRISVNDKKDEIIASLSCLCGYRKEKIVGHLVSVKCKKCKTITRF